MPSYSAAIGALAAALAYSKAVQWKLAKAILSGCFTWATVAYGRCASRALLGLERERSELEDHVAQNSEDAFEPEVQIFDCHHHLWDFRVSKEKMPPEIMPALVAKIIFWMKPKVLEGMWRKDPKMGKQITQSFGNTLPLCTPYMGAELTKDISNNGRPGHTVIGTMYLECGWHGRGASQKCMVPYGEVPMVEAVARQFPKICQGIIAHADLALGAEVEPILKLYKEKHPSVKGIRDSFQFADDTSFFDETKKGRAQDPKFREGFALLEKYGLTYDCWLYHVNLADLADLAKNFPNQKIVCDHVGFPLGIGKYNKDEVFPIWKDHMSELAKHPNVFVKIGGLGMRFMGFGFDEQSKPPTSDTLAEAWRPYVEHTIAVFGVDRCMLESNFPMDKITCSYTVLWNALKKTIKDRPLEDKKKLCALNALRIYGVTL